MSKKRQPPICPYCDRPAKLELRSDHVYRQDFGPIWECAPCSARVGCHPMRKDGFHPPLGRLANAELRAWKNRAHAAFDPLVDAKMRRDGVGRHRARGSAYKWLAGMLGMTRADCHIALMDVERCKQVVEVYTNRALWKKRAEPEEMEAA